MAEDFIHGNKLPCGCVDHSNPEGCACEDSYALLAEILDNECTEDCLLYTSPSPRDS